ncbi:hypothetical protein SY83_16450 [Paenibacillus swuensis]|uniref:Major facilitator superfamily (MFS) profile domain-containing protein n=1 Tax=Paenibacillus swuensis TaxID=1178515 RepID=A0A172TKQ7_9BACL|nr:MFS transporter [Paenibacillus swuensis]ANE47610.1 hypothetical protein SY83_16450 [Paenibacillus swuensis]
MRNTFSWISEYPKEAWPFLAASLMNSMGSAFMWPMVTLYVHNVLDRSYGDAGFALLCQSIAMMLGQFAVSALYQRLGIKVLLIGGMALAGVSQMGIAFTDEWGMFLVLLIISGFFNGLAMPAIQAYVGFRWKDMGSRMFNFIYVGNNIGMAVGTALAGLTAMAFSFSVNFGLAGASSILFALYLIYTVKNMDTQVDGTLQVGTKKGSLERGSLNQKALLLNYKLYVFMSLGSLLIWFSNSVWNTGIAPYLNESGNGLAAYSFLWTVNGIIIFVGQPLLSWLKRISLHNLPAQMTASAICYGVGYVIMIASHSYSALILGMIIATFGEMLIAPAVPAFITAKSGIYAPFYLGIVGAIGASGRIFGPYALGTLYDLGGLDKVLLVTLAGAVASALCFAIHSRLQREPKESLPVTAHSS